MNRSAVPFFLRTCRAVLLGLCLAGLAPSLVWAVQAFGVVELTEGAVSIVDMQGQARIPQAQDKLLEGDTVVTGRDGEVHIRTEDNGFVAVRPNTKFRIDAYAAHADLNDKSITSLLVGSVRSITGWIGKFNPDAYAIKTPSATIGVRGTDHEPSVILPAEPGQTAAAEPGTYDKVNQGNTVMRGEKGSVELKPNQAGFTAHRSAQGPITLAAIPAFYKPSRHEARIGQRKESLAKNLEQHRAERLKRHAQKAASQPAKHPAKTPAPHKHP